MALCLKYLYCFGLYLSVLLPGIVSGEIDDVYKFLSWRVDDVLSEMKQLKVKFDNIDGRVKHVEEKLQGLHTTTPYLIDLRTEHGRQELETKVNENSKMQALAVEKMLSKEKVLLRKSMENFTAAFAEMKSEIQTQMSVFNTSFKEELGRIGTNFDHLKSEVRSEIMEYNKTLSEDISDINAILETNLKDMYEMDNNNSMLLMKGIAELTSDWNSTTHNISQIIQIMEGKMVSNIEKIEKRLIADEKQEQNKTLQSISTLQEDVQSLSRNISTVTSDLSSRILSESSSLSSQIFSHSNRIYRLEERINECLSSPCMYNATCVDGFNSYSCICLTGYSGTNCEIGERIRRDVTHRVAFFASLSSPAYHLGANQDIAFDHVVTNIGYAYNERHGVFVAPVGGTYVFSCTVEVNGQTSWAHFVVNRQVVAKLGLNHFDQVSQTIVVTLNAGDDVSVQNTYPDRTIHENSYSTFSGFLLYEGVSSGGIIG